VAAAALMGKLLVATSKGGVVTRGEKGERDVRVTMFTWLELTLKFQLARFYPL